MMICLGGENLESMRLTCLLNNKKEVATEEEEDEEEDEVYKI